LIENTEKEIQGNIQFIDLICYNSFSKQLEKGGKKLGKQEITNFEVNAVDNLGNPFKIKCEGVDDNELAHFGGLDLHVKAVKILIENTNGMSFAESAGDYSIKDKVTALYLNQIGQFIKDNLLNGEVDDVDNMELVKHFLDEWYKNKEVVGVIEQENERNRIVAEEIRKEEDAFWDSMKPNSK
jgi:hypothetical protein